VWIVSKDSPKNALLAVLVTALVCSSLVSAAVVLLRPIQLNNQLLEQSRNIMQMTGLLPAEGELDDDEMLGLYKSVDRRIINISDAVFDQAIDPNIFDKRKAVNDKELGVQIPTGMDLASIGRRSRFAPVYMVWKENVLERVILPVRGAGMWSMLYGYIALESDLNTIAGMTFYEQNETPGLGDQITHGHWLEQWQGRRIYDEQGEIRFRVSEGVVAPGSATSGFEVDALTGATVTGNAVTNMMHYWFGPHGYQEFLADLREQPPAQPVEGPG
jgi:Na+-transporting NADH:ubiquinone oxidoreductase subunit C